MENKIKSELLDWTSGKVKGFYGKDFINIDKGGVKLVKIDPFAEYPEHIHPDKTEFAYVIEGIPEMLIDNQQYTSEPGNFFIFPATEKHSIKNKTNTECLLLIGNIKT